MGWPFPVRGATDGVVRYTAGRFDAIGLPYEITRRGAIRATLRGRESRPARVIVAHLDTLGAMVREIKPNGRLGVVPIGHWSARFAEGVAPDGLYRYRPVAWHLPPLKTSGHAFGGEVDTSRRTGTRWKCAWTCVPARPVNWGGRHPCRGLDRV